jgi:capsular polysaccharide biosynthesis protein
MITQPPDYEQPARERLDGKHRRHVHPAAKALAEAERAAIEEEENDWFNAEPPMGRLWVLDLQRLKRRAKTRLILIFSITFLMTGVAARKFSKRGHSYDASVFLAFDESALSSGRNTVPGRELTQYVAAVLIPDKALADLANRRNLHPLRRKLGDEYAVSELRMQFELESIQNDYAERRVVDQARTAHVQITVSDATPEEATMLANDLAEIAVKTSQERAAAEARALADDVERAMEQLRARADETSRVMLDSKNALAEAKASGDPEKIAEQSVRYEQAEAEWRRADSALEETSKRSAIEATADELQKAGLGIEARITDRKNAGALVDMRTGVAMAVTFVFFGALIAVSMLVAAFDSRIHDAEDVSRLGLPVLGQVPDFPGQTMGSLQQRGVRRHRVPSFLRWPRS